MNSLTPPNRLLKFASLAVCLAAFGLALAPQKAHAGVDVSFNVFYDSLQPYGQWVDLDEYGSCWVPSIDDPDWRPYNDGSWEYTEYGWTWVSDEPWGWATYHYGRWMYFDDQGWAWVPGYEWAPAWVSWRTSDDYIGWAPLPPEPYYYARRSSFSISFSFGPSWYNFCETRYFGHRRLRDRICRSDQNVTIINKTVNKTKIVNNTTIINNNGPDLEAVNRRSERRIERTRFERRDLGSAATLARNTERNRSRSEPVSEAIVASTADPAPERVRKQRRADRPTFETRQTNPKREASQAVPERIKPASIKRQKADRDQFEPRDQPEPRTQRSFKAPAPRMDKQDKKSARSGRGEFKELKQKPQKQLAPQ